MCSEIPEHIRESFRSMKGYGAKPKGDTTQYWIDALKGVLVMTDVSSW